MMAVRMNPKYVLRLFQIIIHDPGLTAHQIRRQLPQSLRLHLRSVQRDLRALEKLGYLQSNRKAKPYTWTLKADLCPCCLVQLYHNLWR